MANSVVDTALWKARMYYINILSDIIVMHIAEKKTQSNRGKCTIYFHTGEEWSLYETNLRISAIITVTA